MNREVRRALVAKEWRELRPALLVGVLIFVGLPLLWTLLFAGIDPNHDLLPGMATFLGLLGGWFFAAIVAAQCVCRDFGRDRGQFLTGLPVTRADIIDAKCRACVRLILLLMSAVFIVEIGQLALSSANQISIASAGLAGIGVIATLASFGLAFATTCITRQTVSGLMLTGLMLVLVVTLPTITTLFPISPLVLFPIVVPSWNEGQHASPFVSDWLFMATGSGDFLHGAIGQIMVVLQVMTAAVATALGGALLWVISLLTGRPIFRSQREARLTAVGFFCAILLALRWAGALTIRGESGLVVPLVIPFGIAVVCYIYYRVCAVLSAFIIQLDWSVQIGTKTIAWTIAAVTVGLFMLAMNEVGVSARASAYSPTPAWKPADRCAASTSRVAIASGMSVELFSINDEGRIVGQARLQDRSKMFEEDLAGPAIPVFDAGGRLVLVSTQYGRIRETPPGTSYFRGRWKQIELRTERPGEPHFGEPSILDVPIDKQAPFDAVGDALISGDTLYLLLQYRYSLAPASTAHLYVATYSIQDRSRPTLEKCREIGFGMALMDQESHTRGPARLERSDGDIVVLGVTARGAFGIIDAETAVMRVCAVEYVGQWITPVAAHPVSPGAAAFSGRAGLFLRSTPTLATTDKQVYKRLSESRALGSVPATPLAWVFRSISPALVTASPGRVWEIHDEGAIFYDVTNPLNPRRIEHVVTPVITGAVSGPRFLVVQHASGFSIVMHPK